MKLFFSDAQLAHKPKQYMVHGRIVDPFESPERATTLLNALEKCGLILCNVRMAKCPEARCGVRSDGTD